MTMAIAKTLIDTLELRAGSTITKTEIDALKKRWRPHGRLARHDPDALNAEMLAFCDALPMRVSDEQAMRGLEYLRKLLLRKDGELRDTALIRDQGLGADHLRVLRTIDHFLFMGFHEDYTPAGHLCALYPIYRVMAYDGDWFDYVARPWVGGLPTFGQLFQGL